ncbi:MAG: 5-methyltetrahydropteroyltriglutamate--homocysteine methyltransferase, partial [uncultured Solirubrobacteraceae bacterium]
AHSHRARRLTPAAREAPGRLPGLRRRQDRLRRAPAPAGRRRPGLHPPPRADGGDLRHRRRAARVELRDLPDHRHPRGHRPGRQPRGRRAVLRDLRRRPPSSAAAPDRGSVPLQDVRLGVRREERGDRLEARQAGRHRPVDADAALPAGGRARRLHARGVPRRPLRPGRAGHPSGVRGRRRARLDRLHRGPAREQERLAQPLDEPRHAPGLHRPQQPRDRPLLSRGAAQHRHPHVPGRRLRLRPLQGGALRQAAEQDVPAQRGLLPHPVRVRGRQGRRLPDGRRVLPRRRQRHPADVLHGGHQPTEPGRRDRRAGARPARRRRQAHPGRAPRRDRRLRLLAVQPRPQAPARVAGLRARHRDAEDRQPRRGRAHGLRGAGGL